jgi:hypothetical protein
MKKEDVVVGGVYLVKVGNNPRLSRVRITSFAKPMVHSPFFRVRARWEGVNLATGRTITGTAARLRRRVELEPGQKWEPVPKPSGEQEPFCFACEQHRPCSCDDMAADRRK